jgi:threonylcarbamoyladenosine tRNA methylthiotransferase MtaB
MADGGPVGPRAPKTAAIVNLGCKVNRSEVEAAARLLREGGVRLVGALSDPADLVLVNTCTVTGVADQKSRQAVRRARRSSPDARLVVTGCSVQVDPDTFAAIDPRAVIVDNDGKADLLAELADLLADRGDGSTGPLAGPLPTLSGVEASPIDGIADGRSTAERTRAFVKVQDGCSFHCTDCIIPRARGPERSLPPEVVLADVRRAVAAGHREIVLTGINVGTYDGGWSERGFRGRHVRSALSLAGLVRRILEETEVERIRLSSIEPQHVDEALLETWAGAGAGRCMPHLHVPLQSGDDGVLRRMGRRYDTAAYSRVVERAREVLPYVAVHADVIVGFPSEDEAAFERTVAFLRDLVPAGLHVFRYSARPGTPAVRMAGQIPEPVRRARAARLLDLAAELRARRAAARVGAVASVLVEERLADGRWTGHAEDHQPVVMAAADAGDLFNAIVRCRLEGIDPGDPDRVVGRPLEVALGVSPEVARGRPREATRLPMLPLGGSAVMAPSSSSIEGVAS